MNISPTPKRYYSRMPRLYGNMADDDGRIYKDPYFKENREYRHFSNPEKIIPDNFKESSYALNDYIRRNKELVAQLRAKEEDNARLRSLVDSLRQKLVKYTTLKQKLENENEFLHQRVVSNESVSEHPSDYIQIPKRQPLNKSPLPNNVSTPSPLPSVYSGNKEQENAINEQIKNLSDQLSKLTSIVLEKESNAKKSKPASDGDSKLEQLDNMKFLKKKEILDPTDEDIMCRESVELKDLEHQIEIFKKRLLIRRENEVRKASLNRELSELMHKLDMAENTDANVPHYAVPVRSSSQEYCTECHNHHHHHHHHHDSSGSQQSSQSSMQSLNEKNDIPPPNRPNIPSMSHLGTPTPVSKRPDSH